LPSEKVPSIYDRSASRASSVQTFATAAESMPAGSSQIDSEESEPDPDYSETRQTNRSVLPNTTVVPSTSDQAVHTIS
jgi:hypothetical protein